MLLGIDLKELKTYVYPKTCIWVFIAALFIIAKTWEQPQCPFKVNRQTTENGILFSTKKK